jgi:hypothetical protein
MLPTVNLDHDLGLDAGKIRDISPNRMLSPELRTAKLPPPSMTPKCLLGIGHAAPQ